MKHLSSLCILVCSLVSLSLAAPPVEVTQSLQAIHESIQLAAHVPPAERMRSISDKDLLESPETTRYWEALKSLAIEAAKPRSQVWMASLDKLDQEILEIAQDYQSNPKRTQLIADWYGGYGMQVPQRASLELINAERMAKGLPAQEPVSEVEYKNRLRAKLGRMHVPVVYGPIEIHVAAEYRLAWEAWLLAPLTTRHKAFLIDNCPAALKQCATDASIPVLLAFARQVDEKTHKPQYLRAINHIAAVWDILIHLRSSESLLASLQVVKLASERNLDVSAPSIAAMEAKSKLSSNQITFIENVSGYLEKVIPGLDNLYIEEGRLFLPAINELLSRPDVAEDDKVVLQKTKERILKYTPEPKRE